MNSMFSLIDTLYTTLKNNDTNISVTKTFTHGLLPYPIRHTKILSTIIRVQNYEFYLNLSHKNHAKSTKLD